MNRPLQDKCALLTRGSRGISGAIAEVFACDSARCDDTRFIILTIQVKNTASLPSIH